MKIIKQGIPAEEKKHRGQCSRCETQVEFYRKEGTVTYDQRDGNFVTVKCPVCGHPIHSSLRTGYIGPG